MSRRPIQAWNSAARGRNPGPRLTAGGTWRHLSFHSSVSFFVLCCITQIIAETTQYQKGEACSSTNDCFGGMACLPGPDGTGVCCEFPHSDISVQGDPHMRAGCASCGDKTSHAYEAMDRPGVCTACSTGYTYLSGEPSNDLPWYDTTGSNTYYAGLCVPDDFCDITQKYLSGHKMYLETSFSVSCSGTRQAAGTGCIDAWGNSLPTGFKCLSQKCLGGYCCAEDTACASGLCDSSSGACSVKVQKGEACSSTDDCFGGMACLPGPDGTGVCCEFPHSDISVQGDPHMRAGCASCGDKTSHAYEAMDRPGVCTACSTGYTYLSGEPSNDLPWYDTTGSNTYYAGLCVPDDFCDITQKYLSGHKMYLETSFSVSCSGTRQAAGTGCIDAWGNSLPTGFKCLSQKCLGGYCCADEALLPLAGECCSFCAASTGECVS